MSSLNQIIRNRNIFISVIPKCQDLEAIYISPSTDFWLSYIFVPVKPALLQPATASQQTIPRVNLNVGALHQKKV